MFQDNIHFFKFNWNADFYYHSEKQKNQERHISIFRGREQPQSFAGTQSRPLQFLVSTQSDHSFC